MRTERLLACVAALGLLAGFSYAVQSGEAGGVDAKAQSGNNRSVGDQKKVSVPGGGASVEAGKSGEGSRSVTVAGDAIDKHSEKGEGSAEEFVTIEGTNQHLTDECNGRSFRVQGTSNTVNLTGQCQTIKVTGKSNRVDVEAVAAINVSGIENQVTWEQGVNNRPPSIASKGINNSVSKKSTR